ncbi:hypothetical protein IV203_025080 [Nitzschia inconspicua]|uniref:Uncharacterized protein n=1 Tax=Nitzschia inconspicua TaxID=303405 RepID=A0A9K3PAB2_9STRA|nr:hypothetical protein IV203_025173 [Nitzschia inconspicua]KAG7365639.1 hypothetical protein IV203_025080 [Nitzschia inconspicua]
MSAEGDVASSKNVQRMQKELLLHQVSILGVIRQLHTYTSPKKGFSTPPFASFLDLSKSNTSSDRTSILLPQPLQAAIDSVSKKLAHPLGQQEGAGQIMQQLSIHSGPRCPPFSTGKGKKNLLVRISAKKPGGLHVET